MMARERRRAKRKVDGRECRVRLLGDGEGRGGVEIRWTKWK